jgi:dTDP-glucose 4,6-dehydratase
MLPLFITNCFDGEPLPSTATAASGAVAAVDDHCAAIELVLRKGESGNVYNVGGQERENLDVVRRILDLTGGSPDLVRMVKDREGHDRRYAVDSAKVRDLGWSPQHSFDKGGLEATVEWYREHSHWWEPVKQGRLPPVLRTAVRA